MLARTARSRDDLFNVIPAEDAPYRDVDLGVRSRPVSGEVCRGGGLILRGKHARNDYPARYDPLEPMCRLHEVVDGE